MSWRQSIYDWCVGFLWLVARLGLLLNCIILSAFSVWFVWRSCWKLMDICEQWFFGG